MVVRGSTNTFKLRPASARRCIWPNLPRRTSRRSRSLDKFPTVTAEPLKALRLTDCENPTSATIYMRMPVALMKNSLESKTLVAASADGREFELNDAKHETILKACESRWEMLHSPIHSAAFTLNPRFTNVHSFSGDAQ
jgi:hypothetical protein